MDTINELWIFITEGKPTKLMKVIWHVCFHVSLVNGYPRPCIIPATWQSDKIFCHCECSFHWKWHCHWLKFLRQRQSAVLIKDLGINLKQSLASQKLSIMKFCDVKWWIMMWYKVQVTFINVAHGKDFIHFIRQLHQFYGINTREYLHSAAPLILPGILFWLSYSLILITKDNGRGHRVAVLKCKIPNPTHRGIEE